MRLLVKGFAADGFTTRFSLVNLANGDRAQVPAPPNDSELGTASLAPTGSQVIFGSRSDVTTSANATSVIDASKFPSGPFTVVSHPQINLGRSSSVTTAADPATDGAGRFVWAVQGSSASSPLNGVAVSDASGRLRYVRSPSGLSVGSPALVPDTPGMALVVRASTIQQIQLDRQGQPEGSSTRSAPFARLSFSNGPLLERDPAFSPDGRYLAWLRVHPVSSGGQHAFLMVYDTQTQRIVLPGGRDLGVSKFVFGLSLANLPTITGFRITLLKRQFILSPTLKIPGPVGILVQRVVGTHVLLGRRVARLELIGRVPLGRAHAGLNNFRWNGTVNGRRLKPGKYQITLRSLSRSGLITDLSRSRTLRVTR